MGWKNLPYWLKGGVIFLVISIFLHLFIKLLYVLTPIVGISFLIWYPLSWILYFLPSLIIFWNSIFEPDTFIPIVSGTNVIHVFIFYFIIGAIIGWIYGKIKSRKQLDF